MTVINNQFLPPVDGGAPSAPPSRDIGQEEFLQLLMTQMGNQDPLNPMKTDEFMNQITAMNALQQQIATNDRLDELVLGMGALNNASAMNLVGQTVVAVGDTFAHEGGAEELRFELAEEARSVSVEVLDENGAVVRVISQSELKAGPNTVTWDGRDADGNLRPPGEIRFRVVAKDADGDPVGVTTLVEGVVDELRFDTGAPQVVIGGQVLDLAAITRVIGADEPAGATPGDPATALQSTESSPMSATRRRALQDLLQTFGQNN